MLNREQAMKESTLRYSFMYKMRIAFTGKKCPICGCTMDIDSEWGFKNRMPSIQHNNPISKGGKHEIENISIICRKCNVTIKDNKTGSLNNNDVIEVWNKIKGCK